MHLGFALGGGSFLLKENGRNVKRGEEGEIKLLLLAECKGKGMWGRGPCKHTPYITVKNKAGAGLLLCQRLPGAKAWPGGSVPPHPRTHSATPKGRHPSPAGRVQGCTAVHA